VIPWMMIRVVSSTNIAMGEDLFYPQITQITPISLGDLSGIICAICEICGSLEVFVCLLMTPDGAAGGLVN
jgi:hypothetical protein